MALKKPVIATNTGGIPELIQNNKNGLLVPKENPRALADAMSWLVTDKALQKRFREQAFRDAHHFEIKKTIEKTTRVYRELYADYL